MPARRWKNGGVVNVSSFNQLVEKPFGIAGDRKSRGSITPNGSAGDVLEHFLRTQRVFIEGFRRKLIDQLVRISVGADLVPMLHSFLNQRWKLLRHPSEEEACNANVAIFKHCQQALHA